MAKEKLLEIKNLKTYFYTEEGVSKAVDGVDFEIYPGETLGVVGESGCGKSVTSLSVMRLIPEPPGKILEGEILFKGQDLTKLSPDQIRDIRGNEISMIFQEPMTSLNPVFTVGNQIAEAIIIHKQVSKKEAMAEAVEMLRKVGIPLPEQRINEYPHQLSGGMRQRVMIAMALSCNPALLIADEPTTALDVTIQAQILELMEELKEKFNMSIMMITHDLGVIAEVSDRVAVMYAGKIVEYTDARTLFAKPQHPYTWGLMNSIPRMDKEVERLTAIPGIVPSSLEFPEGCRYNTRCLLADEKCIASEPPIEEVEAGHHVRCWYSERLEELKTKAESA
ncbi:MAG: ABC transporter ATP-binding protein [Halanaerobiales bacterium]|nr:ABC transporter ATP-binding protein [Halanaerobiales bacterium]